MSCQFDRIQFKKGYYWEFWIENPVLKAGEPSYTLDEDHNYLKIGDGVTPWRDLPCFNFTFNNCEPVTTTPGPPPPPEGDKCNPMICVAYIDEISSTPKATTYGLVDLLFQAFPKRLFFLAGASGGESSSYSESIHSAYLYFKEKNPSLFTGPTQRFFDFYEELGYYTPRDNNNGDDQAVTSYIDNGGTWADINKIIATKDQEIKDLFEESNQIAIFIDTSGSTVLYQIQRTSNALVSQAALDGYQNVSAINNGRENMICPFCQVECCESLDNQEDIDIYNQLKDECARLTGLQYPECDTVVTTTTTVAPTTTTTTTTTTVCPCPREINPSCFHVSYRNESPCTFAPESNPVYHTWSNLPLAETTYKIYLDVFLAVDTVQIYYVDPITTFWVQLYDSDNISHDWNSPLSEAPCCEDFGSSVLIDNFIKPSGADTLKISISYVDTTISAVAVGICPSGEEIFIDDCGSATTSTTTTLAPTTTTTLAPTTTTTLAPTTTTTLAPTTTTTLAPTTTTTAAPARSFNSNIKYSANHMDSVQSRDYPAESFPYFASIDYNSLNVKDADITRNDGYYVIGSQNHISHIKEQQSPYGSGSIEDLRYKVGGLYSMGTLTKLHGNTHSNSQQNMTKATQAYMRNSTDDGLENNLSNLSDEQNLQMFNRFGVLQTINSFDNAFFKVVAKDDLVAAIAATGLATVSLPNHTTSQGLTMPGSKKALCGKLFIAGYFATANASPDKRVQYSQFAGLNQNYLMQVSGEAWVDFNYDWYNFYAIDSGNNLYRWGNYFDYYSGNTNSNNNSYEPVFVSGNVMSVDALDKMCYILDTSGTLYVLGQNFHDNPDTYTSTPRVVTSDYQFLKFANNAKKGTRKTYVIDVSGDIYSFYNANQSSSDEFIIRKELDYIKLNQTSINNMNSNIDTMDGSGWINASVFYDTNNIYGTDSIRATLGYLRSTENYPTISLDLQPYQQILEPNFIYAIGYPLVSGADNTLFGFYSNQTYDYSLVTNHELLLIPIPSGLNEINDNQEINNFDYSQAIVTKFVSTEADMDYVAFISGVPPQ